MFNPETVKAGDKNTSVLLLQEILRARGFKGKNGKALKLTWTADANTIYALKAYQNPEKKFWKWMVFADLLLGKI